MGQPSSRSESEYSDGVSDVDMEDASLFRSGTEGISPDDVSDDYSFMSLGSSDDNQSLPVRRKHRPKSLNLSRSVSGTSSEDETSGVHGLGSSRMSPSRELDVTGTTEMMATEVESVEAALADAQLMDDDEEGD